LKYFPNNADKQADKDFVVDVINTLDPAFFPACASEIDKQMLGMKKEDEVIQLTPEMHHFILQLQNLPANRNPYLGKGTLRIAKQPRKKPEVKAAPLLSTKISIKMPTASPFTSGSATGKRLKYD